MFRTGSRPVPPLDERSLGRRVSTGSLSLLRRRWRGPVLVALFLIVGGHWLVRFTRDRAYLSSGLAAQQSPTAHRAYIDKLVNDRSQRPAPAGGNPMRGIVKQKLALVEGKRRDGELDEWERQQKLDASRTEPDKDAAKFMPDKLRSSRKKNAALPPFGAAVPDAAADDALCGARVADADEWAARFANSRPAECRLLVAAWVAESEASAQKHLIQMAALARRLQRTLVLPNVHRGSMGTCLSIAFEAYYDMSAGALVRDRDADRYLPEVEADTPPGQDDQWLALSGAVSFAEFRSWVETRQTAPSAQIIEIHDEPLEKSLAADALLIKGSAHVTVDADTDPTNSTKPHCLASSAPRLDFARFSPLHFWPAKGERWHEKSDSSVAYGHAITTGLLTESANPGQRVLAPPSAGNAEAVLSPTTTRGTPDVLVVAWGAQHPALDIEVSALPPLGYASRWTALAGSLVSRLGPFIAVHWRMEHIADDALAGCASALIKTLLDTLAPDALGEDVAAVWLATDYPGENGRKTSTFVPGPQAQAAMRRVKAAFGMDGALERVRLTTLAEEMSRSGEDMDAEDEAFTADPGFMAIIDKNVAVRAPIFVTGGTACGINSAFTKEIRDRRAHVIQGTQFKHDDAHPHGSAIRNLVSYFG